MDDIVEKLRDYGLTLEESMIICDRSTVDKAAGVIENLRRDLTEQKRAHGDCIKRNIALAADNARLAKELEEARKALEPFAKFKTADGLPCGFLRIPDEHPMLFNGLGDDIEFVITVGDFRRAATIRHKATVTTDDMPEGGSET